MTINKKTVNWNESLYHLHWIGLNGSELVNWQSIGIGCLTDFISRPGPRSFPSIEGNDRGPGIEMKLYTWLPVNWRIDVGLVDSRHGQYWWFAPKSRLLIGRLAMLPSSHWSMFLFHNHVNQNNSCISRYHLESDQKRVSLIYGNSQKALANVPHTHVTGLPFLRQKLIKTDLQVF